MYQIDVVTSDEDRVAAFNVRRKVFVEEQQVPEELELDEFDAINSTYHLLARDPDGIVVGTARFRPYASDGHVDGHERDGEQYDGNHAIGKVERVAVVQQHRGTGLGRQLMEQIERLAGRAGFTVLKLNAQVQAIGFYERLGYHAEGEVFLDAGIEHRTMWKELGSELMIYEITFQVRVTDFTLGQHWYQTLLGKAPDFTPHEGFAEWELIPGTWLQVADGMPTEGSGPLRLGVTAIELERDRVVKELGVEPFEIFTREGVPVKWGTFTDPWGNRIGFFEYIDDLEKEQAVKRAHRM